LEHVLYMWQGFIAKNPGWSPIQELATPADTYIQSTVKCTDHATPCVLLFILFKYVVKSNFNDV